MNNDLTGVTEAGYADKIMTGIDKIKGDYSTLPKEMQQLFIKLRAMSKSEGIDMERTFQDAGGTRFGTLSKRLFKSALCIAFHHYTFSEYELAAIAEHYDCGLPDTFNGGLLDVAWRDFTNDVLSAEVIVKELEYTETDMDATDAGYADKIASGIDRVAGGFEDLPRHLQQVLIDLRKMAKIEGINLEMVMQVRAPSMHTLRCSPRVPVDAATPVGRAPHATRHAPHAACRTRPHAATRSHTQPTVARCRGGAGCGRHALRYDRQEPVQIGARDCLPPLHLHARDLRRALRLLRCALPNPTLILTLTLTLTR
jgi:hypothetical protein